MEKINKISEENLVQTNFKTNKISKIQNALMLLFFTISLSSCSAIAGIFKAGMGVGIFVVIAVIVIIVLVVRSMGKK